MLVGEQRCSKADLVWSFPGGCVLPELLPSGHRAGVLQGAGIQVWRSSGRGSADPRVEEAAWFLPASMFELLIGCSPLTVRSTMAVNSALLAGSVRRCSQRPMIGREQMGLSPAASNGVEQRSVTSGSLLSQG